MTNITPLVLPVISSGQVFHTFAGLHHTVIFFFKLLENSPNFIGMHVYFIDKVPGCTKDEAHRSLSSELKILLKIYQKKAVVILKQLP
jgi:hypothetical protein